MVRFRQPTGVRESPRFAASDMRWHTNGLRFVVHADEKLTAFVELEAAIFSALNDEGRGQDSCPRQMVI